MKPRYILAPEAAEDLAVLLDARPLPALSS